MLIMSIFLILTFIMIVGTLLYVSNKKNKIVRGIKDNTSNVKENKKSKSESKKQLKDILGVKIKDSIILFGTRYSSIIKLGNVDYNMLSNSEQEGIENVLIQTALSIDYPIQFFSTTEYVDTSKVIQKIKENKIDNKKIQEYQNALIDYLDNLMNNRNISVINNYAIISYDGYYENAIDELNRRVSSFKSNLLRAKVQCEVLEENEIYNLFYRELNKNSNSKIDLLKGGCDKLYVEKSKRKKRK